MPLAIEQREVSPGVVLITLSGKVMLGRDSQELETLIPELIRAGKLTLIFDLSGVAQIDSTGIGRFIYALTLLNEAGGKLAIAGAAGHVRNAFRVTRLDQVFQIFPDVEAARAGLG